MATGEQTITVVGGWQEVIGATGSIILQNQHHSYTAQYYIGAAPPNAEHGIDLRMGNEHCPEINPGEKLYCKSPKSDVAIAWSE